MISNEEKTENIFYTTISKSKKYSCSLCKGNHIFSNCSDQIIESTHQKLLTKIHDVKNNSCSNTLDYIKVSVSLLNSKSILALCSKYRIPLKWYSVTKTNILVDIYNEIYHNNINSLDKEFISSLKKKHEKYNKIHKDKKNKMVEFISLIKEQEKKEYEQIDKKVEEYKVNLTIEIINGINSVDNIVLYNHLARSHQTIINNETYMYRLMLVKDMNEKMKLIKPYMKDFILSKEDTCPICFEQLSNKNAIKTNCNHLFCYTCIKKCIDL
jgi:hypothetical protein